MNPPSRCHRCQEPLAASDAEEVAVEQATSASQVFIHKGGCAVQYVRRSA